MTVRHGVLIGTRSICSLGAFAFLVFFEVNLHCTQDTSFRIAVFEMTPHPEEGADGRSFPAVYTSSFAWLLRTYLGISIVTALFVPAGITWLKQRVGAALVLAGLAAALPVANVMAFGEPIVGERFGVLGIAAAVCSAVLAIPAVGALLMVHRR